MKLFFTIFTVLMATVSFAQRQNVYYLKNNGRYVSIRDSADYVRIVREPDSASVMYNVFEFYLNGKKKLLGKSSTIDPPRFEGQCARFYKNGNKESLTYYKDGLITGSEYDFYPNGKPYVIKEFPDNKDIYNNLVNHYSIIENYDSLGTASVKNGNGYYKGYDNNFKYIEEEGRLENGKRDSVWKGNFKNVKTTFTETYQDGELISGVATDSSGTTTTYSKSRDVPPEFKGGVEAFGKYLATHIRYPSYENEHNIQGRVILSFVVEKDGKLKDIKVNKSASSGLDQEAVRVIKNSPLWVPGTRFGKPVRVIYSVPVSFSLSN